jgi:hypothetical protein
VIGNFGVYRTYNSGNAVAERALNWWLDDSKPPVGKT